MGLLYSKMKIFHFKEKVDSLPENSAQILPPLQIRIKPTNACAHNCWYCAYRAENIQLGKDMVHRDYIPKEKMMEILSDMAEMGVKTVTFSGGGDPFYYPYFLETVQRLSETPVKFAALTNGARLQGEIASLFATHGTWLRISMDGWDDESYSACRRVPKGEFTKVMNNIEAFKKLGGRCYLGISLIVDDKNFLHIFDMIKKLKGLGIDSVKISPCIVGNTQKENNEYHKPIFKYVKDHVRRAVEEFTDPQFEIFDSYHEQLETFGKKYDWCPYIQIVPVIGADLNVYSCHDKAYNLEEGLIGSIRDQRLIDFWFSDKTNFFRINPSMHCNHHCMVHDRNRLLIEYLDVNKEHLEFV